jgi:hypothetical protein
MPYCRKTLLKVDEPGEMKSLSLNHLRLKIKKQI